MNSDSPHSSREEVEARLTALLLGELSTAEAAAMRRAIEQDAELAQVYERLERTIDLVHEAAASPVEDAAAPSTVLKLSERNRQRLLQSFKTAAPKEFTAPRRREMPWFVPMSIAAAAVAMIGWLALLPGFWSGFRNARPTVIAGVSQRDRGPLSASEMRVDLSFQKDIAEYKIARGVTASDVASATTTFNGIVLPFAGDSTISPRGTVTPEAASKPSLDSLSRSGRGGGGGGFGGAGGGGAGVPGASMDGANFSFWIGDPPVTAPSSDGRRAVPDFATQAAVLQEAQRVDSLARNNGEISQGAQNPITVSTMSGRPIGALKVPETKDEDGKRGFVSRNALVQIKPAWTNPVLRNLLPSGILRLNENDLKQQAHADGALALGDVPVLENLFQAGKNIADGAEENAAPIVQKIAPQTLAKDTFGDFDRDGKIDLLQAGIAGRSAGAATGKIGAQGGTGLSVSTIASQVADRREFEVAPLASTSPQISSVPQRDTGVVTASREAESLTRGLAVPSAQGQQRTQPAQLQDKNWILQKPPASKEPSLQKKEKLSEIDTLELAQRSDINGDQSILANRGEQDSAAPKTEPQLGRGYGLKLLLGAEPKAKAAATAGEKPPSIQQSIVLPQKPSDEVENRPLRESGRSAKVRAAPETLLTLREKKRELERSVPSRSDLRMKPNAGKNDATLPKSSMVQIVDLAQTEPEKSPSLVERLRRTVTGKIEKVARIKVPKDAPDVDLIAGKSLGTFDPFFIQTEFEVIQSKSVLSKVIEKLGLNEAWARKYGTGEKLKEGQTLMLLKKSLDVRQKGSLIEIGVKSDNPDEAARIANTIAEVYRDLTLKQEIAGQEKKIVSVQQELELLQDSNIPPADSAPPEPAAGSPIPQPEVQTLENAFSTFSLNVSDVSFKLAAASLEKGVMPEPATVRSEEFINAFDYRDSEPPPGVPIAFAWERTRYPFAHNRDLLRFSIKTAAEGRQSGRSLNLVLLLDNSGSMERADRVRVVREALRVLAGQLQPQDKLSVIAFARNARLWADGVPGNRAGEVAEQVSNLTPQGGTNLEEAMNLAYQTALRHYEQGGVNRVVLLTDGAANLGNVNPAALTQKVETHRKQGIALDCFGIGWEGYNDDLLEVLSRHGDGRYGFINTPEEATTGFAGQLAGALRVAASDVKLQVEFNPKRVTAYRQIGYAKHQLTTEQFRDNTVDAAEMGAAESGNALYVAEVNPRGEGQLAIVRVRFKVPGTAEYREQEWIVPYTGTAVPLEQASSALRLAATASAFSEWLVSSPYAAEVTPDRLLGYLNGVPEVYGIDPRPKQLESMIRQAKSVGGK